MGIGPEKASGVGNVEVTGWLWGGFRLGSEASPVKTSRDTQCGVGEAYFWLLPWLVSFLLPVVMFLF